MREGKNRVPKPVLVGPLEQEWRSFCLQSFGDMSEQQYIDLRRTFYGGAAGAWNLLIAQLDGGYAPTEEDMARIKAFRKELNDFLRDVKLGKA